MNRLMPLVAAAVFTVGAGAPIASFADVAAPAAQIHFALAACPDSVSAHLRSANVTYSFAPTAGDGTAATVRTAQATVEGTTSWTNLPASRLQLDVTLPAGFYHYAIEAIDGKGVNSAVACSYQLYLAALPGKERTITDTMIDGIADPITPVLLAGTLPAGMTAWIVRYDGTPGCGASTTALVRHQLLESEVQSGAYYGYDTKLTGRSGNGASVFGLELGWPNDDRRVIRLVTDYPKAIVSGAPTFVRLDITPVVEKLALSRPANTLVCAGKNAPSGGR